MGRKFPTGFYGMTSDAASADAAKCDVLSSDLRLLMLAQSRANMWGHAAFAPSELKTLMGSATIFHGAKRKLMRAGLISPDSTSLCVVLSSLYYRRGVGESACSEPGHHDRRRVMWLASVPSRWESREGEHDEALWEPPF